MRREGGGGRELDSTPGEPVRSLAAAGVGGDGSGWGKERDNKQLATGVCYGAK